MEILVTPMRKLLIATILIFAGLALVGREAELFPVLKSEARIGRHDGGFFLLPTNQLLRPWGEQSMIPGRPVDFAFDSQKHLLAVLNWRGVNVMDGSTGTQVAEIKSRSMSYVGIA
jgi:hypothetical protein